MSDPTSSMDPAGRATLATATARSFAANPLFRALRTGLRGSQALGVGPAARLAARVFCTPVPTKLASRHLRPAAGVTVERLPFEDVSLTLYRWPAPADAPTVLLTHGWGGWGLQLTAMAQSLAGAGLAPVAVDQPAHGRSQGWASTLAQFTRAIEYLAARMGHLHALVGHSMGGSAGLLAASRALPLGRLVSIAAPADLVQVTRDYAHAFGLGEATRAAMVRHLEAREAVVFERMNASSSAPRVQVPALVVHDRDDLTVPVDDARQLAQWLPQAQLLETNGLGHRRILKDAQVIQRVRDFVAG